MVAGSNGVARRNPHSICPLWRANGVTLESQTFTGITNRLGAGVYDCGAAGVGRPASRAIEHCEYLRGLLVRHEWRRSHVVGWHDRRIVPWLCSGAVGWREGGQANRWRYLLAVGE